MLDSIFESKYYISCNVCTVVEKYSPSPHMQIGIYASVCGGVPRVWLHFNFIFVVSTRGNVTLKIAIGPFVRMTLQSRPICGENRPVCGIP